MPGDRAEVPEGNGRPRRAVRTRVRVRNREGDTLGRRFRKFYSRNRSWLVPAALLAFGTAGVWFTLKFFIPLEE